MEVHGNLNFLGMGKLLRPGLVATDFPPNPTPGEFLLKDKKLFMCVDVVDGLPYWVNLVNELSSHRHDQGTTALEWVINHDLNTNFPTVQVYDQDGLQVIPDYINAGTLNQVTVGFSVPTAGVAVLVTGDAFGQPRANSAYTGNYTGTTWVVTHGLGYNPSVTIIIDNYVVQPDSIVHNSVNQLTVTFSSSRSGSVRCV